MRDVEKYFDKNEHHNGIQQRQKTYTLWQIHFENIYKQKSTA